MVISWNSPKFEGNELKYVAEVLQTGYVSEGPMTKELEKQLSLICGTKHIIMTTSATAALYLAVEADKRIRNYNDGVVIIPNLTFIATKNAVELANLIPKMVDVEKDKYCLNEFSLWDDGHLNGKYPEIIINVNLLGRTGSEMNDKTGSQYYKNVTHIFDNAGCLGSNVPNGNVGCYSLQANKLITCGQGGFCATDDDEYAKVIRQLKDFGREDKYDQHTQGFNFKFNDIQAAVALGQLEQLDKRKELHINQYYNYKLSLSDFGKFVDYINEEIPLWVEFITDKRDELFDYLKTKGIESRKPWRPLVDNPELYPNTDYYCNNCLWLPNGPSISSEQQDYIIKCIQEFYSGI